VKESIELPDLGVEEGKPMLKGRVRRCDAVGYMAGVRKGSGLLDMYLGWKKWQVSLQKGLRFICALR
jgi:hypothetical protein